MPYRPNGIPTVFDVDGDGDEEIGIDVISYMAFLDGAGRIVVLRGSSTRKPGAD